MGKGARIRREHENESKAPKQKQAESKIWKILGRAGIIAICLLVVVGAAWGVVYTTGVLQRSFTAVTVGDYKVSALEFNMYYNDILSNLMNTYAQYGMDAQNLEIQMYDEERTFADYIRESAVSQVTEVYVLYSEAQANGYDYENDVYAQALYQSSMSQLQESAETYEMEPEALLKAIYGNQMKMSDFEAFLTRRTTAQGYAEQLESGLTVSDDEAENYYSENKDEYDNVSYRYFTFPYETVTYTEPEDGETPEEGAPTSEEEATAMTEENRAAAEALANEMLERITDEQSFIDLALEYADEEDKEEYSDDDATLVTNGSATATSPLAQWYSDPARTEGETAVIDNNNNGYTVAYFISRERDESATVNIRHILFGTEDAASDATEEELAAVEEANAAQQELAQQIYDEWLTGDQSEESFAALAREYSDDGNAPEGGIYENVYEGQMVSEFNDWIFDPSRRTGDSDIVETSYGYHIIYFIGEGLPRWRADVETDLISEKYTALYNDLVQKYTIATSEFAMKL